MKKRINGIEKHVSNLETKFEVFLQESKDMRQEATAIISVRKKFVKYANE